MFSIVIKINTIKCLTKIIATLQFWITIQLIGGKAILGMTLISYTEAQSNAKNGKCCFTT